MPTVPSPPVSMTALFAATRFFGRLPFYLHRRLTMPEARALLAARLSRRAERFLERLRKDVYKRPGSVYESLLRHAGCEYGDLEAAVSKDGVETTLARLFREGVYLTVDEFKGRKTVVRGSLTIEASPERLRSPRAAYHLPGSSGGSRSGGTPVLFDLRFVRDCASNCALYLDAWGALDLSKADWESPGAGARFRLMKFAAFGGRPKAWFTQIRPDHPSLPATARWSTRAMRLAGALAGRPFPFPVYAPLSDPGPVARWLSSELRDGHFPFLFTFPSSAVRLCLYAQQQGIDIAGARMTIGGEPITEACAATITQAGCIPMPRYGSMETGAVGYACRQAQHSDEVHLLQDMHALITAGPQGAAAHMPSNALLITALHAQSPFLMLNVSMGDQAQLAERDCGCPLYQLGWRTQLQDTRSFEKLSALGVTFLGAEVIKILEETLPARFGGAPTNYQLVEKETADGQPLLELRVHPSLGPLDESRIAEEFLAAVAGQSGSGAQRAQKWRDANTLRVVRCPPAVSGVGKILHLHTFRTRQI